jgi:hypothetical protein
MYLYVPLITIPMLKVLKREYDDNGNLIYLENSDGYWVKHEYDSNGNRIYYENSTGEQIYFIR